jgi:HK97 family phage portal protein
VIISNGTPIAPQALGEIVPTLSNGYFYAQSSLELIQKVATYGALYRAQPSIATVVDKVASAAARLTIKVWNTESDGRELDSSSPYARLIASPSNFLSPFSFWRWVFSTYEVYGEAFLLKIRDQNDVVVELVPMHPSRVSVRRNQAGDVEYTFSLGVGQTGILTASADDVVPFLRWNSDNLMRGMSRLEPLRTTLANEDAIRRANSSFWKNGARPSLVLSHPKTLSDAAVKRLGNEVAALQSGSDNMGRPLILEEGLTAVPQQLDSEDMQYIESRKLNMQEACMVYDVPPPVVHILDHATFSNITEQMRSMYRDTMTPRLEDVESVIDFHLRPEFADAGTCVAKFDLDDVLRGDFESRVDKATALRNAGIVTGNQALEIIGMARSADPKMDDIYANAALVPLGSNIRPPVSTEGDVMPTALSAEPSRISVRAIMGRIARTKAAELRTKLVDEHQREVRAFFDRQRESVKAALPLKASGVFDPAAWDDELAGILGTLGAATSQAVGTKTAQSLGGSYDTGRLADWVKSNAKESAEKINRTTAASVSAALNTDPEDDIDDEESIDGLFDGEIAARASQISLSRVAVVAGIACIAAAEMNNASTKTWQVTSANPRPEHAAMDGETVALGEVFSNGMNGPGDPTGGADEVAGCTCDLTFGKD